MPRSKLTDKGIKAAVGAAKNARTARKVFDGGGLFLHITATGAAFWRYKYRVPGRSKAKLGSGDNAKYREKVMALGVYPQTTLAEAREAHEAAWKRVEQGGDPSQDKQDAKRQRVEAAAHTYELVAARWIEHATKKRAWTPKHQARIRRRFELYFYPWIGSKPITDVTDDDIRAGVQRLENRGRYDTARRTLSDNDSLFRYARKEKLVAHNVVADVRSLDRDDTKRERPRVRHHAGLKDPKQVGALMKAIDAYHGSLIVKYALKLQALLFVRPGAELRWARWSEFELPEDWFEPGANLEGATWRIPGERMKAREYHLVPLAAQAIKVLRDLHRLTGPGGPHAGSEGFVFPAVRNPERPISENTLNVALRSMGYTHDQQTGHGFRTTASTLLNEVGWNGDAIERQLSHGERDETRASYNSAEYLPERRRMMAWWGDCVDALRAGLPLPSRGKVVSISRRKSA